MKVGLYAAIVGFLLGAALIIGCGGGGGGGGTGGPGGGPGGGGGGLGTDAPLAGQYIEFIDGSGDIVDPLCLRAGQVIQLRAVNYDPAGNRTVLATGNWTSAGGAGGSFSLTTDGVLTINSSSTGFFQVRVTVTIGGGPKDLVQDARGTADTTTVSGRVTDAFTGNGIKYIQVEFYSGGLRVGATLTGDDGYFTGCVPTTVSGVSAKGASIPSASYYRQLRYNSNDYTVDGSSCPIPFSISNAGGNNSMPFNIRLIPVSSGPPPPPGGCL